MQYRAAERTRASSRTLNSPDSRRQARSPDSGPCVGRSASSRAIRRLGRAKIGQQQTVRFPNFFRTSPRQFSSRSSKTLTTYLSDKNELGLSTPSRARRNPIKPADENNSFKIPVRPRPRPAPAQSALQRRVSAGRPLPSALQHDVGHADSPSSRMRSPALSAGPSPETPRARPQETPRARPLQVPQEGHRPPTDLSVSPSSVARPTGQAHLARSTSRSASSARTPLRNSTTAARTPTSALSASQRQRVSPKTVVRDHQAPATAIRRKPTMQSAIPVPRTNRPGERTLQRPSSSLDDNAAASKPQSGSEPGPRAGDRSALGVAGGRRASSAADSLRLSQTSRKSSWETVRSVRNSLAPPRRRSSGLRLGGSSELDGSVRPSSRGAPSDPLAIPVRTLGTGPALGSVSTSEHPTVEASSHAAALGFESPPDSTALPHFSHAAFLSPMPPSVADIDPNVSRAARTVPAPRARPRESTSLDEILRLGMLNQSLAGGNTAANVELELLLDEGSSRVMTEELRTSLGAQGSMAGERGSPGPTTPWRGRVVSLDASTRRRSFRSSMSGLDPLAEDQEAPGAVSSPRQDGHVLLLRQSTHEASDLRRQVAALNAELDRLRLERDEVAANVERKERDGQERVDALLREELEAAHRREAELRSDWEAERRAMEEDMAALAAAASAVPAPRPEDTRPPQAAILPDLEASRSSENPAAASLDMRLALRGGECAGALAQAAATFSELETFAARERDDARLSLEMLQTLSHGLEGWRGLL
ncbi:hypothetical protein JCM8202_001807 [Rhodotorula sphaerocarpa]